MPSGSTPTNRAIIHGPIRRTWSQTATRCRRLASALSTHGIGTGNTVAAASPPSVLSAMEERGFAMTHVYGLTETYGPAVICSSKPESGSLSPGEQAKIKARQGVSYHSLEDVQILDAQSVHSVAYDTTRLGEAMFPVYPHKGLSKESQSDGRSFCRGWFHSGDLGR